MKTFFLWALLLTVVQGQALSSGLDDFHKRFDFVRGEDNLLIEVRDLSMTEQISPSALVKRWKEHIRNRRQALGSASVDEGVALIFEGLEKDLGDESLDSHDKKTRLDSYRPHIRKAIGAAFSKNVEDVFDRPSFKEVIASFNKEIKKSFVLLKSNVLARPQDKTFFYKRTVSYEVVRRALNFAAKRLPDVPVLHLAKTLIIQYEKMVRTRRYFHQNMLLHYLENFPASQLGLKEGEVARILSSIYEARIAWSDFKSSRMAKNNWNGYGQGIFSSEFDKGTRLLEKNRRHYEQPMGERINFAFQDAVFKGEKVILNLLDRNHQFSRRPSIAFYYSDPLKVKKKRIFCQLGKLGLGFVPGLPSILVGQIENFLESLYEEQALTEGALAAHFASSGQEQDKLVVLRQTLNPFFVW